MNNQAKAPHKAILLIQIEVHDILPTGECSGVPISRAELAQYELKPILKRTINGFDRHECLRKLSEIIKQLESN